MISANTKVKRDISSLPPVQCDLLFIPYIEGVIRQIFCSSPSWSSQALTPNSMLCFMQASWRKDSLNLKKYFKVIVSLAPVSWPDFLLSLCVCAQSCPTLCDPMGCSPTRLFCPWIFPGKNTALGYHFLRQGSFRTQGSNLRLLHWQAIPQCCATWGAPTNSLSVFTSL